MLLQGVQRYTDCVEYYHNSQFSTITAKTQPMPGMIKRNFSISARKFVEWQQSTVNGILKHNMFFYSSEERFIYKHKINSSVNVLMYCIIARIADEIVDCDNKISFKQNNMLDSNSVSIDRE